MYHGYVPGVISLQRYMMVCHRLPLPLHTGTAVHVLFYFFPSTGMFTVVPGSLFWDHGLDCKEMS